MTPVPHVVFKLHAYELRRLKEIPDDMPGGHQSFHRSLLAQIGDDGTVMLDDCELGKLVRHMGYGSGGYQGRLRKAFGRSLRQWAGLD